MFAANWLPIGLLIVINLGLIWFLMAAPIGKRTVMVTKRIPAASEHLWSALFPFGSNALWDGTYISVQKLDTGRADVEIAFDGRDGKPIRRTIELSEVEPQHSYVLRVIDDNSLHGSFWTHHQETVLLESLVIRHRSPLQKLIAIGVLLSLSSATSKTAAISTRWRNGRKPGIIPKQVCLKRSRSKLAWLCFPRSFSGPFLA